MARLVRRGFTLVEVVVTVVVVSVVAAVVIPAVIRQITVGDPARIQQDLQSVRVGIENFALNMRPDYPSEIEHLLVKPSGDEASLGGASYTAENLPLWRGPYLEKVITATPGPGEVVFSTGFNAEFVNGLQICSLDGAHSPLTSTSCVRTNGVNEYVTVAISGLNDAQFGLVNTLLDEGTTSVTGRFQRNASGTSLYFAYPYVTN